ncbi:MAG: hypothetical protein V4663_06655 [Bacteroidota bacterium]
MIEFYTKKLGFTFYSNWDGYLMFGLDKIELHFWSTNDPSIPKNTGCYINVTEVDKLYAEYELQGVIHPEGKLSDKP